MKLKLVGMKAEQEEYAVGCNHAPTIMLRTIWTLTWQTENIDLYEYNVPDEVAKTLSIGYEREWKVV